MFAQKRLINRLNIHGYQNYLRAHKYQKTNGIDTANYVFKVIGFTGIGTGIGMIAVSYIFG